MTNYIINLLMHGHAVNIDGVTLEYLDLKISTSPRNQDIEAMTHGEFIDFVDNADKIICEGWRMSAPFVWTRKDGVKWG